MREGSMETTLGRIGRYAEQLSITDLDDGVLRYAKRIVLDSLACAFGGFDAEPARIVLDTTKKMGWGGEATVWADGTRTSPPLAALANGVALRYLDYNDVYFGPAWTAHPSDNLATLLAVAESNQASGSDLLAAMIVTYEVQLAFSDLPVARNLWHAGWHHTTACSYASAAGVGRLLGLDAGRIMHAMALAGARSNTLAQIRHGNIPMDKALSAPLVASNSILLTLLAQNGFTGSETLLEGPYGFGAAVAGGADVEALVPDRDTVRLSKVSLKPYPVEGMTPAMVQAALEIRRDHGVVPSDVKGIRITTHEEAVNKPSWSAEKLAPTTKETADHSFFYCVAVALAAGEVTPQQFSDEWLGDPAVADLIARSSIAVDDGYTELFRRGARPAAVEIETAAGALRREVLYPLGDPRAPMTDDDVARKFLQMAGPRLGDQRAHAVIERTLAIEEEPDVEPFVRFLAAADG